MLNLLMVMVSFFYYVKETPVVFTTTSEETPSGIPDDKVGPPRRQPWPATEHHKK